MLPKAKENYVCTVSVTSLYFIAQYTLQVRSSPNQTVEHCLITATGDIPILFEHGSLV